MDKIIREFKVDRGGRDIIYPFTTYSCVFAISTRLSGYLSDRFTNGVVAKERMSISEMPQLLIKCEKVEYPSLVEMAKNASYRGAMSRQHSKVQNYFLDKDPHTIAIEIPVYNDEMLGHIDIIRLLPSGIIEVLDFKPNAHKETKAASQLFRYASRLSVSLGLPLTQFRAYYFDDKNIYQVTL